MDGIDFLVAIVGLFAVSEIFIYMESHGRDSAIGVKLDRITIPLARHRAQRVHDAALDRHRLRRRPAAGGGRLARQLPRLHGGEVGRAGRRHLRHRQSARGGGAGGRQQRRRGRRAGPDADPRGAGVGHHRGASGAAAHAQHHSRSAPVRGASRGGVGAHRGAAHRELRPAGDERADGEALRARALGAAVDPAPRDRDGLLRRDLLALGERLRSDPDDHLRVLRLPVPQDRGADRPHHSRHPAREQHGGQPAPRHGHLRRRLDLPVLVGDLDRAVGGGDRGVRRAPCSCATCSQGRGGPRARPCPPAS